MNKLAALKELTLFERIEDATLQPLLDYFIVKRFERGDVLWREGGGGDELHIYCGGQGQGFEGS